MAARKRNWQTNKTREKIRDGIQTGLIVKRFENHLLKDEGDPDYVKLTTTQIKAGQVLLDRTMPTLSSSEITEVTKDTDPQELLAQLAKVLPKDMVDILKAKFMPTVEAPETLQ